MVEGLARTKEVRVRLAALVDYVFVAGPVLRDGQKLQIGEGEMFEIAHGEDAGCAVIRLSMKSER